MTAFVAILGGIGCIGLFVGILISLQKFSTKVMGVHLTSRGSYKRTSSALNYIHQENLSYLNRYTIEEIERAKCSLKSKFLANTSSNLVDEIIKIYGHRKNKPLLINEKNEVPTIIDDFYYAQKKQQKELGNKYEDIEKCFDDLKEYFQKGDGN